MIARALHQRIFPVPLSRTPGGRRQVLLWCLALLAFSTAAAPADLAAVRETAEWSRLADLWHEMLDHSSELTFSRRAFDELSPALAKADADIGGLWARGRLSKQLAPRLRWLFHLRYDYIAERHYTPKARVSQTAIEAAYMTARWVTESHLNQLRGRRVLPPDAVVCLRADLAYQLSFICEYEEFEAESKARRASLEERAEQGKATDWQSFEQECQRRRSLLVEAYHGRRIGTVRAVEQIMPYALALTETSARGASRPAPAEPSPI